ncbi:MAG: hypothetical protein C0404_06635 [Verrucomicrobia bacterium]|nr:hypothetical protein [Verrucomicrobiota bacterium]
MKKAVPAVVALLVPALAYFAVVMHFAVDVPYWDDYDTVLAYANRPAGERMQHLFSQHHEHRLVLNRLLCEAARLVEGKINFAHLILLGNAMLVILFCLIWTSTEAFRRAPWMIVPAGFLLFQVQAWENIFWVTSVLQNNGVLLFAFGAFVVWRGGGWWRRILAALLAACAAFTNGNGFLVAVMLAAAETVRTISDRDCGATAGLVRRWGGFFFVTLACAGVLAGYFWSYEIPAYHPSIPLALLNPHILAAHYLALLGSYMIWMPLAIAVGAGTVIFAGFLLKRRYYSLNPAVFWMLAFLLASLAVVSVCRSGFGMDQALSSRYKVYTVMIMVCMYVASLDLNLFGIARSRYLAAVAATAGIVFSVMSYAFTMDEVSRHRQRLVSGIEQWRVDGTGLTYRNNDLASPILRKAIDTGAYSMPRFGKVPHTESGNDAARGR